MKNLRIILTTIIIVVITIFIGSALRTWYLFLKEPESPAIEALADNTVVIVKTKSIFKLVNAINESSMLDLFVNSKRYHSINQWLDSLTVNNGKLFRLIESNEVYLAFAESKNNTSGFLILTEIGKTGPSSVHKQIKEIVNNDGYEVTTEKEVRKISNGHESVWYFIKQGVFALSDDSTTLVSSYTNLTTGKSREIISQFTKLEETGGKSVDANILINSHLLTSVIWPEKEEELNEKFPLSNWVSFDLNIKKGQLLLDGFSLTGQDNLFEGQEPVSNVPVQYYPQNTAFGLSIMLSDPERYISGIISRDTLHVTGYDNSIKQQTDEIFRVSDHLRAWVGNSISLIFTNDYFRGYKSSKLILISHKDADSANYYLSPFIEMEGDSIGQLHYTSLAKDLWGEAFSVTGKVYCKITPQFVLLSPDRNLVSAIISSSGSKSQDLASAKENSGGSSNLFIYLKPEKIVRWFSRNAKGENQEWVNFISQNRSIGFQYSASKKLAYTHAWLIPTPKGNSRKLFAEKSKLNDRIDSRTEASDEEKEIVKEEKEVVVDKVADTKPETKEEEDIPAKEIAINSDFFPPQILNSSKKNEKRIGFLTKEGKLLIYNYEGKLLWEYKMSGKPSSNIREVDFKKNGKMHYVVASGKKLYIIDPDGKEVTGSPFKLPGAVSGEISLFDYDNRKDYRLLYVGTDHLIYNTTLKGEELPDWIKPKVNGYGTISFIRTGGKDYLVYKSAGNEIKIFDRRGKERIKVKDAPLISKNSTVFENKTNSKGIFIFAGKSGQIGYISSNGLISNTTFDKFNDPWFAYNDFNNDGSYDFLFSEGNRIVCYNRVKEIIMSKTIDKAKFGVPFIYSSSPREKWVFVRDINSSKIIGLHSGGKTMELKIKSDTDPVVFNPGGSLKEVLVTTRKGKVQLTELEGL